MNVDKCVCLRFGPRTLGDCSRGNSPYRIGMSRISFLRNHKDLGVRVDRLLKFHDHIRNTASACNAVTTNLLSSTVFRDPAFIMTTYKSLVQLSLSMDGQSGILAI